MPDSLPPAEWRFSDPKNLAVITTKAILYGTRPIFHVFHNADDGGWQFLDGDEPRIAAAVVSVLSMVQRVPTICALANLPLGWQAWREHPDASRQRRAYAHSITTDHALRAPVGGAVVARP